MSLTRACDRCGVMDARVFLGPKEIGKFIDLCPGCKQKFLDLMEEFLRG